VKTPVLLILCCVESLHVTT